MSTGRDSRINFWLNNSFQIELIDQLHYAFIELMYEVEAIVNKNSQTSLQTIIIELEKYSQSLKNEENLLRKAGFNDTDNHIIKHNHFYAKIKSFKHELTYNHSYLSINILNFLKKWLISHIIKEDKKYRIKVYEYLNIKYNLKSNIWLRGFSDLQIDSIDNHHNKFLDLLYNVEIAIKENNKTIISSIIQRLEDYVTIDLKEEEELFIQSGFKNYGVHISQHRLFATRVKEFKHEHNYQNQFILSNILNFLKKWLISHILKEDKEYRVKVYEHLNIKYNRKSNIWLRDTALKIESIDNHHKKFLDILYDIETANKENNKEVIPIIINRLKDYAVRDLNEEEELLRLVEFKNIEHHIAQHRLLLTRVEEWTHEYNYENHYISSHILSFLKKWLISHILKEDKEYREEVYFYLKRYCA
ncbi:bacteriohemerythrin [Plebeiibacterium sediminum]|uniref:Hemerythrin family protein n=1 Tax=Plebeiibacterium sediminum TaxID=2992112 RepID=A0AAE3SEI2_9BACT|nr:hemerythrin family protein [Plebeiobacterium sediminum]MCW3786256.1 hemerythrin family protein [Plebeiobacterium sediminum]